MEGNSIFQTPESTRLHWNYFLALEKDLEVVARYIEFCPDNFDTYSIEFAHLLLSAASEVDTLAKCICAILAPNAKARNINEYRDIIKAAENSETYPFSVRGETRLLQESDKHRLSDLAVYVPRYRLKFVPWASWAEDKNPDWWGSYNRVKHERNRHFKEATLGNALNAIAALLTMNYAYCRYEVTKDRPTLRYQCRKKTVVRYMDSESTFLRFEGDFYDNIWAELGSCMSGFSRDVQRLEGRLDED